MTGPWSLVRSILMLGGGVLISAAAVRLIRQDGLRKGTKAALSASLAGQTPVVSSLSLAKHDDRGLRLGAGLIVAATLIELVAGSRRERGE